LLDDVSADDLNNEDNEWISVSRTKLLELASFCAPDVFVTPEERQPESVAA
jgi:hypothetical protein